MNGACGRVARAALAVAQQARRAQQISSGRTINQHAASPLAVPNIIGLSVTAPHAGSVASSAAAARSSVSAGLSARRTFFSFARPGTRLQLVASRTLLAGGQLHLRLLVSMCICCICGMAVRLGLAPSR